MGRDLYEAARACWEPYRDALSRREGCNVNLGEGVGVYTTFDVGESMEVAVNTIRGPINAYCEFLRGSRPKSEWTKHGYLYIGEEMTPQDEALDWFDFQKKRGVIMVGDAAYVAERFVEKQETIGLDHLML